MPHFLEPKKKSHTVTHMDIIPFATISKFGDLSANIQNELITAFVDDFMVQIVSQLPTLIFL